MKRRKPAWDSSTLNGDGTKGGRPPYDPVAMFKVMIRAANTGSDVRADTAWHSRSNETRLTSIGRVSRVHRKKLKGQADANADRARQRRQVRRSCPHRACVRSSEDQMGLFVRTIGIVRAETKITLADLVYNIGRLIFHERRAVGDSCAG